MTISAGLLRDKITVERPVRTSIGGGAYDTTYTPILSTFSQVIEKRSDPAQVAGQENIYNFVSFRMRYRPDIFIKNGDRLTWRGNVFTVNNIKVDYLRTFIEIFVSSEMETSQRSEPETT